MYSTVKRCLIRPPKQPQYTTAAAVAIDSFTQRHRLIRRFYGKTGKCPIHSNRSIRSHVRSSRSITRMPAAHGTGPAGRGLRVRLHDCVQPHPPERARICDGTGGHGAAPCIGPAPPRAGSHGPGLHARPAIRANRKRGGCACVGQAPRRAAGMRL